MRVRAGLAGAIALAAMGAVNARSDAPTPPTAATPVSSAPPASDQCGAADLAGLVGKPRTEIPVPVDPSHRRVYCTTCIITQDYDPTRLDIVFDSKTGLITQVKCG